MGIAVTQPLGEREGHAGNVEPSGHLIEQTLSSHGSSSVHVHEPPIWGDADKIASENPLSRIGIRIPTIQTGQEAGYVDDEVSAPTIPSVRYPVWHEERSRAPPTPRSPTVQATAAYPLSPRPRVWCRCRAAGTWNAPAVTSCQTPLHPSPCGERLSLFIHESTAPGFAVSSGAISGMLLPY